MDKQKIINLFDELLDEWYQAEDLIIQDRSSDFGEGYKYLNAKKEEYLSRLQAIVDEK